MASPPCCLYPPRSPIPSLQTISSLDDSLKQHVQHSSQAEHSLKEIDRQIEQLQQRRKTMLDHHKAAEAEREKLAQKRTGAPGCPAVEPVCAMLPLAPPSPPPTPACAFLSFHF